MNVRASRFGAIGLTLGAGLGLAGCHRDEHFESVAAITAQTVVERDESGQPELVDLQIEWDPCPGDQVEMIRGGREFARCVAGLERGQFVPVKVLHQWDTRGYWTWAIESVNGCPRPVEKNSPGSYERSQECRTLRSHGFPYGFKCDRQPKKDLVDVCPWTRR